MNNPPRFEDIYPNHPEPKTELLEFVRVSPEQTRERAKSFYQEMNRRRTTRHFSIEAVPQEVIEHVVLTAGTAPSGAHRQPWHFVAVQDASLKQHIREAVEEEEYKTYTQRMPEEWRGALAAIGTDYIKTHLTEAPWLIVVFKEKYGLREDGSTYKNYYVTESVGIAVGMLISAIHYAGLVTLTHTPNPMGILRDILQRPINEEPMLIMPVGYPADQARVPQLSRKPLSDILKVM